jgi:hypothetical protein
MFSFIKFSMSSFFDLLLALSFTSSSCYHYVIFYSSPFFIVHFAFHLCYSLNQVVFLSSHFFSLFLNSSLSRSISLLNSWFPFSFSFISSFISTFISSNSSSIFSISLFSSPPQVILLFSCLLQIPSLPPPLVFLFCPPSFLFCLIDVAAFLFI